MKKTKLDGALVVTARFELMSKEEPRPLAEARKMAYAHLLLVCSGKKIRNTKEALKPLIFSS